MAFGVDNTFASRALDNDVFAPYAADAPGRRRGLRAARATTTAGSRRSTTATSASTSTPPGSTAEGIAPPETLDDLVDPAYEDLFVLPGAASSSTGLAFLLATIAEYGDDWPDYWTRLMDNGAKLTAGWSDAYEVDFTQGGGEGDRPIVLSYDSSPAFTDRRRREHHDARCSTPASARSSTPACSTGADNPDGRRGRRRLAAVARGAGGAADEHVRLPGRRRRPSCRPTGRRTPSSPTSRSASTPPRSPRTATTG